jgi:hypothetical protein
VRAGRAELCLEIGEELFPAHARTVARAGPDRSGFHIAPEGWTRRAKPDTPSDV